MKKDQLDRIYHIHRRLRTARQPVASAALAQELEISRATVFRDLELLRDRLGAPLVFDPAGRGYRYDPQGGDFELPGLWFNASELHALLAAEQLLEAMEPGILAEHLQPLRSRIGELLTATGHQADRVRERVLLQPVARRRVDPGCFACIAGAALAGHVLVFDYHGRARDTIERRRVHPQRLVHYRNNWYLVAYCERAQDLRNFSLDRITRPVDTGAPADAVDNERLAVHLSSGFGIFGGPATHEAVLRFTVAAARWVADEQWHPQQRDTRVEDGCLERRVPYSDPTEIVMEALRYGPDCEVLAPEALRAETAARLEDALRRYASNGEKGSTI